MSFIAELFSSPVTVHDLLSNSTAIVMGLDEIITSIIGASTFVVSCNRNCVITQLVLRKSLDYTEMIRLRGIDPVIMRYRGCVVKINSCVMTVMLDIRNRVMWSYDDLFGEFLLRLKDIRYKCRDANRFADDQFSPKVQFWYRPDYKPWKPFSRAFEDINIIFINKITTI